MAKAHDRILQITVTPEPTGNTLAVDASGLKYFRDRGQLEAGNGFLIAYEGGSAAVTPVEIKLGETIPPPSIIRFVFPASF